jgi:hypothetical protein
MSSAEIASTMAVAWRLVSTDSRRLPRIPETTTSSISPPAVDCACATGACWNNARVTAAPINVVVVLLIPISLPLCVLIKTNMGPI